MSVTRILFQRVDTDEFGRITTTVFSPEYDQKGNFASGKIKLHDHLRAVVITDEWEENQRVWRIEMSSD